MRWQAHAAIGAAAGFLAFLLMHSDAQALIIATAFSALCALVPDLDHESSKGRRWLDLAFAGFAFLVACASSCGGSICMPGLGGIGSMAVVFLALIGAYFLLFLLFKPRHRGITHTLAACIAFGVIVYALAGAWMAFPAIIGYFSHLAADRHIRMI